MIRLNPLLEIVLGLVRSNPFAIFVRTESVNIGQNGNYSFPLVARYQIVQVNPPLVRPFWFDLSRVEKWG